MSDPGGSLLDVQTAWRRLLPIRSLAFEARSRGVPSTGWNGCGQGVVRVEPVGPGVILFHERGSWTPEQGPEIAFSNLFRWTVDPDGRYIRLEHLRFGPDQPIHLCDLVPVDAGALESSAPHACRDDRYAARLEIDDRVVRLRWTITGPRKAETVAYTYR